MRNQPVIVVALISMLMAGCASKRRAQIEVEDGGLRGNNSQYWGGSEACDSCDGCVSTDSTDLLPSLPRVGVSENSKLKCSGCSTRQDLLVDGMCVSCLRNQRNMPATPSSSRFGGFKKASSTESPLPPTSSTTTTTNGSISNRLPVPGLPTASELRDFLPNQLPLKTSAKKAVEAVKKSVGSKITKSAPVVIQAKDAAKNDLKDLSRGVGNQLESARNEVKNTLKVLSEPIVLAPNKSFGSSNRLESPLQELMGINKQPEPGNSADKLVMVDSGESPTDDAHATETVENEVVGEIKADAATQEVVTSVSPAVSGEVRIDENAELAEAASKMDESEDEPDAVKESSSFSKSLSGSASALADPKFETFRLDDLFPGKVQKQESKQPVEQAQPKRSDRSELMLQPADQSAQSTMLRRTEQQVVEDLKKGSIPSRVVFDNTPAIAEQLISKKQIVLHAVATKHALVESPAELQSPVRQQVERMVETQGGLVGTMQMIQVKSQKLMPESSIEFRPLPELNAMVEEIDLSLESGEVDNVYNSNRFPTKGEEPEFVFEGLNSSSLAPGEFSAIEKNAITLPTVDNSIPERIQMPGPKTDSNSIILRAVPASADIRNAIHLPQDSGTKATFQFVQPKFQRVVDDE